MVFGFLVIFVIFVVVVRDLKSKLFCFYIRLGRVSEVTEVGLLDVWILGFFKLYGYGVVFNFTFGFFNLVLIFSWNKRI